MSEDVPVAEETAVTKPEEAAEAEEGEAQAAAE